MQTRNRFWIYFGEFENRILENRLSTKNEKPIFVCGLARSGTTIVTHILNQCEETASFLYRDLPFVHTPYFWSGASRFYYMGRKPVPRVHGDGLMIDPDSPDAFEEIVWRCFLDEYFAPSRPLVLDKSYENRALERYLKDLFRRVQYVRGNRERYLSKGNYNICRLAYILRIFPDAKFVLCFRDPEETASSMTRVHKRLINMAKTDPAVSNAMDRLCHFEFGPQRRPIDLGDANAVNTTLAFWCGGQDTEGYLNQWMSIYRYVFEHYLSDSKIRSQIFLLDHLDLVRAPHQVISRLLKFLDLDNREDICEGLAQLVSPQKKRSDDQPIISPDTCLAAATLYKTLRSMRKSNETHMMP